MKSRVSLWGVIALSSSLAYGAADLQNSIAGRITDGEQSLQYRLFTPAGLAADQKAPLVVFLHGAGERGSDNVAQTTHIGGLVNATSSGKYASYLLAPQIGSDQWFQSWDKNKPTEAMSLTIKAVKQTIAANNIDPSRVYVTGLSMGAMGTWDILSREPNMFAAAITMSGGGDPSTASAIKDIPTWSFHGDADGIVPVQATRDMIQALRDAGGTPRYTEIAGGGHGGWEDLYNDADGSLYSWLFAQHRYGASPTMMDIGASSLLSNNSIGAVPEPSTMGLLVLGSVAALLRRRRRN